MRNCKDKVKKIYYKIKKVESRVWNWNLYMILSFFIYIENVIELKQENFPKKIKKKENHILSLIIKWSDVITESKIFK